MDEIEDPTKNDPAGEILADAINIAPPDREEFVRGRCGGDAILEGSVFDLLARFERMGTRLGSPAAGQREFSLAIGDVLDEQYRVLAHLGSGGMGEVYRAEDLPARDIVALKVIRPEWAQSEHALERFRAELRQARRIGHPNVCRMFLFRVGRSLRTGEQVAFFAMEFLDGETLGERLRAGPIPRDRALAIARGIASGLDATHELGILHRDLKPGNIMLARRGDGSERTVITDFGLSKELRTESQSGNTGQAVIVGSYRYMAPEQFDREGRLTAATDNYAFALILWELVTGRPARGSEEFAHVLFERCAKGPPSIRSVLKDAPEHWDAVFAKALAKEPLGRYGSATAVLDALTEAPAPVAPVEVATTVQAPKPLITRRRAIAAGAAAFFVSAGYGVYRLFKQGPRIPDAPMILLTSTRHDSDTASSEYAGAADLLLKSELEQSARIQVVSGKAVASVIERMKAAKTTVDLEDTQTARVVALRSGANLILFTSLTKAGDNYTLDAELELLGQSPRTPLDRWPYTERFVDGDNLGRVGSQVGKLARELRTKMNDIETAYDVHSRPAVELTTGNFEALQNYVAGDRAWPQNRPDALRLLEEATKIDPHFALAWGRLADLRMAVGHCDEAFEAYARATEEAAARNLSNPESFLVQGRFALDREDYGAAAKIFGDFRSAYPKQSLAYFYGADCARRLGDIQRANFLLNRGVELSPGNAVFLVQRALYRLEDGDLAGAEAQLSEAAKAATTPFAPEVSAGIALSRGNAAGVENALKGITDDTIRASYQACWAAERGRFDDAVGLLAPSIEAAGQGSEERFGQLMTLAGVYLAAGRKPDAARVCDELAGEASGSQQRLRLAAEMARAGDSRRAARMAEEAMHAAGDRAQYPIYKRLKAYVDGEVALAEGRADEAADVLGAATPVQDVNVWPSRWYRAAVSAGRRDVAGRLLGELVRNPGRWFVASGNEVGFLRGAVGSGDGLHDGTGALGSALEIRR